MFRRNVYMLLVCLALLAIITSVTSTNRPQTDTQLKIQGYHHHKPSCDQIELHEDQCAFVQSACHGFSGTFLKFYYCSSLWKPITVGILLSGLVLLFSAVSVVASDFFCPNLQTISSKLQLSESMAGVTVLALGNGSPDLFSTFSAMDSGAGSLAIGELIGAAFFIVAIVSGSMGVIRPFQSKRITFMRDATFLTGAIIMITWIVYHRRICWYHGLSLIAYYLTYVAVVVLGTYSQDTAAQPKSANKTATENLADETSRLLGATGRQLKPPRLSIPPHGFASRQQIGDYEHRLGHIIRPMTARSPSRPSLRAETGFLNFPRTASANGSLSARLHRHPMTPRIGIRTSLLGAIEFQEHISAIRRASSSHSLESGTRQRLISMPHWKRASHASISHALSSTQRPRASTVNGQLLITHPSNISPRSATPDSARSSTGVAEDYFAYLAANQRTQYPAEMPSMIGAPSNNDFLIPEIRLAPPNPTQNTLSANHWNSEYNTPIQSASGCLNVLPHSPSFAHSEDDVFVSARQSPEISPSPSMYCDPRSISIVLSNPADDENPFGQTSLNVVVEDADKQEPRKRSIIPLQLQDFVASFGQTLFPTMQNWCEKSFSAKLSALIAVPLVLMFTLTLPVAEEPDNIKVDSVEVVNSEDDDDGQIAADTSAPNNNKNYLSVATTSGEREEEVISDMEVEPLGVQQEWCRWLLSLQAFFATTFLSVVMAVNSFIEPRQIVFGSTLGSLLAVLVYAMTDADKPPKWFWMLSFAGFFVALNWIFLLANEMVGLLKALGMIFNISDAIMGLTVFAFGNSIGDLVANTAIAKMGFPTMAISACYAGPLLNMVLGVGISSSYQVFKTGRPYELDIAPTILVSSTGLMTVLLSTLIVVNMNGYRINKALGLWMISVYILCSVIDVSLELFSE